MKRIRPCPRSGARAACVWTALTLTLAAGCRRGAMPAFPPPTVQTTPALATNAPVLIEAFGHTEPAADVNVMPQVSGRLLEALIQDGAAVTNGQTLFRIDPSDYAARVKQAEAAVAGARADLELRRQTLARNQALAEKKLISDENFDALKTAVDAADAQQRANEAALDQARLNLERCAIAAPVGGVCARVLVKPGNLVAAGLSVLTNIKHGDPMTVEFTIPERHLDLVRDALDTRAATIEIVPEGDTNRYGGALVFVNNAVDPATGSILLRGQVPNPRGRLWAGQFVSVTLRAGVIRDAVLVPEGSIQMGKQGAYLYVVTAEQKADLRPVRTGVRVGNLVQVEGPVRAGEAVVALGQLMLWPGAPVNDLSRPPPPGAASGTPAGAPAGEAEKKH